MNTKRLIISIFIIGISFFGCSNIQIQQTAKSYPLKKLKKSVSIVEKHYIKKLELYKLLDLTIDAIVFELKDTLNKQLIKTIEQNRPKSGDSKAILFKKLANVIKTVEQNTSYNLEQSVNLALKGLINKLDKHSKYINVKYPNNNKPFKIEPFYSTIFEDNILYLKIPSFDKEVVNNIKTNIKNNAKSTKAIILDFRNNLGGRLEQGIGTVDLFVNHGTIVSLRKRDKNNVQTYKATLKNTITNLPVVVLVNTQSASSSEIVSGALQDLHRATIIGEKTFGKGTVQALIYITNDKKEAIKLSIAKYYLPSGRSVDSKITPDIEISQKKDQTEDNQLNYAVSFLKNKLKKHH